VTGETAQPMINIQGTIAAGGGAPRPAGVNTTVAPAPGVSQGFMADHDAQVVNPTQVNQAGTVIITNNYYAGAAAKAIQRIW
jgi:hypothetical protein